MITPAADQRVVAGAAATLTWQPVDSDGEAADPGTVTVGVTRADGTVLVAAGTATDGSGTVPRTYGLTAAQTATIDHLIVSWSVGATVVATTTVDIAGRPMFTNAELRAREVSLANLATFTPALVSQARLEVESFIERVCNRGFVPRYNYTTIAGPVGCKLFLPHPELRQVRSAVFYGDLTEDPTQTLTTELAGIPANDAGIAYLSAGWGSRWLKIGYEYGSDAPPADLKRQAMRLCREVLTSSKSGMPENAVTYTSTELGWSAVLITPGVRGAHTRFPEVNEALDAHTFDIAVMA